MQEYKIIFAGSMGAGKTSAVSALSEIDVVSTDVVNTDREKNSKLLTTVGIDYGQIVLPPDVKIGLYGTPGQERFEAVWRIVTRGALGAIVLIDVTSPDAHQEIVSYIDYFQKHDMNHIVVGLTHYHEGKERTVTFDGCIQIMQEHHMLFPVFIVDTREKDDVILLINALLTSIEA